MTTTIIQQPPLRLITTKSKCFPEGNRAAFNKLESPLRSLKGRRFYGLAYEAGDEMEYFAGLCPDSEIEELKFSSLGFKLIEVPGGRCARTKILDWTTKIDQIGPTFGAMIGEHGIDPTRPQIEYYRSLSELHLLLPIPD